MASLTTYVDRYDLVTIRKDTTGDDMTGPPKPRPTRIIGRYPEGMTGQQLADRLIGVAKKDLSPGDVVDSQSVTFAEPDPLDELLKMPEVKVTPRGDLFGKDTVVRVGKINGTIDPNCRFYHWRLRRLKERLIREHYANLEVELSCKTEDDL